MDLPFATLEPANVIAKMAFSDVYEAIMRGHQETTDDIPAAHRMNVEPEQRYHKDVLQFRREMDKLSEGDFSESPTEPDTDAESEIRHRGMIWTGRYVLGLRLPPFKPDMGWVAGKGPGEKRPYADIFFCTRAFAKRHNLNLRSFHARFNFDLQNRAFFITSITTSFLAGLAVNGVAVGRQMHTLNQHSMKVHVGSLEYDFQYTNHASSEDFMKKRQEYLTTNLGAPSYVVFDMPTPRRNIRTIGQWTLGDPLGKGSAGRVFLGSNSKNEVVAVKIMVLESGSKSAVEKEIAACRALTALAEMHDDGGRIVRLRETIDPRDEVSSSSTVFDELGLILEPMTPKTMGDLVGNRSMGGSRGMSIEAAAVFRDALLDLKFMHDNGWVHRDMKPHNIGVISGRAVLLDVGQAKFLRSGFTLRAKPGRGGTVNYLAPEREMTEYDHSADMWPMGCIGFELTYGYHPFKFAANPWRPGEYEAMQPAFHQRYQEAIDKMLADHKRYADQRAADRNPYFVHLGDLLVQMLRHPFADRSRDRAPRINVDEALEHPAWKPLLSDGPQAAEALYLKPPPHVATTSSQNSSTAVMTEPHPPGDGIKFNWDFLNVVASQGAYLHTRPNTPIHPPRNPDVEIEKFEAALTHKLDLLLSGQESRRDRYGDAADEWPPGHTPPELVKEHAAEMNRLYDLMDAPSPPSDCSDNDSPETKAAQERWREIVRIMHKPPRPEQRPAARLPTPSSSSLETSCSDSSPVSAPSDRQFPLSTPATTMLEARTTRGRKRRRSDVTGEEAEAGQPKTKKTRTIAAAVPAQLRRNTRLQNARLRRGTG